MSVGGKNRFVGHHGDVLNPNSFPPIWVRPVNMLHRMRHRYANYISTKSVDVFSREQI